MKIVVEIDRNGKCPIHITTEDLYVHIHYLTMIEDHCDCFTIKGFQEITDEDDRQVGPPEKSSL